MVRGRLKIRETFWYVNAASGLPFSLHLYTHTLHLATQMHIFTSLHRAVLGHNALSTTARVWELLLHYSDHCSLTGSVVCEKSQSRIPWQALLYITHVTEYQTFRCYTGDHYVTPNIADNDDAQSHSPSLQCMCVEDDRRLEALSQRLQPKAPGKKDIDFTQVAHNNSHKSHACSSQTI